MANFPTRRRRKKRHKTCDYRISTVIRVDSLPPESQVRFSEDLEEAIYDTSANYPAVSQYLVKLIDSEVVVGLQIEKVTPENVENIATALLQDSIRSIEDRMDLEFEPEVEESDLYLV